MNDLNFAVASALPIKEKKRQMMRKEEEKRNWTEHVIFQGCKNIFPVFFRVFVKENEKYEVSKLEGGDSQCFFLLHPFKWFYTMKKQKGVC